MSLASGLRSLATRLADRVPSVIELYRWLARPRWQYANFRDARATYRALDWIRELPEPGSDSPAALVVRRREDIFDTKVGLMLGAAMKLEDVRPVVLANHRRTPRIQRYARAFGVTDLRYRDRFELTPRDWDELEGLVAELMPRGDDLAAIRGWRWRGLRLGDRVLSTLIRELLIGRPDLSDPAVQRRLERILRAVLVHYHQAEKILDAVAPRWVLADETGYAENGPLVDVALSRGLDCFEISPFVREGALMFKRVNAELGRAAAASVAPETLRRISQRPWGPGHDAEVLREIEGRYQGSSALQVMYQADTERIEDRRELCARLGWPVEKPLVVVFTHVLWDASFFYGEDLFLTFQHWLEETLKAALANPRVNWLIKTHPSNAFRLGHGDIAGPVAEVEVARRCCGELPEHVRLLLPETRISSLDLYRHADVGVTVRGTPGLEMACLGKPVLTAGSGHYSGLGFTIDSRTPEEYLSRLTAIEGATAPLEPDALRRARIYAHALFNIRPWRARSFELRFEFQSSGWHPLDRNVVPVASDLEEVRRLGDLHRWAAWAVGSEDADYLEEPAPGPGDR